MAEVVIDAMRLCAAVRGGRVGRRGDRWVGADCLKFEMDDGWEAGERWMDGCRVCGDGGDAVL